MEKKEIVEGDEISGGAVVTKYGHKEKKLSPVSGQPSKGLKKIKVFEAAHPIPDENGFMATEEIVMLSRYKITTSPERIRPLD